MDCKGGCGGSKSTILRDLLNLYRSTRSQYSSSNVPWSEKREASCCAASVREQLNGQRQGWAAESPVGGIPHCTKSAMMRAKSDEAT